MPIFFHKLPAFVSLFICGAGSLAAAQGHNYREKIAELDRQRSAVHWISQADLSADGNHVAWSVQASDELSVVRVAPRVKGPESPQEVGPCKGETKGDTEQPVWSPKGEQLALLSDCKTRGQLQLFVIDRATQNTPRQLTSVTGFVAHPLWSPDGQHIAFLFVDHATRVPSPMAAIDPPTGVIDDLQVARVQRIAVVDLQSGQLHQVTPPGLNVYEYDWSPDSESFAFLAAPPPGDDNWYVAKLYRQALNDEQPKIVYQPKLQIAVPRWSPDGKSIGFIEGLMSDEGGNGGELYIVPASGGPARDLTPERHSSPSCFSWLSDDSILLSEFKGGSVQISTLRIADGTTKPLWEGGETINSGPETTSLSVAQLAGPQAKPTVALIRSSWSKPPEVWAGPIGKWTQVSSENASYDGLRTRSESVTWRNGGFDVQGWLVFPANYDPHKKYGMITWVHGGPAWIFTPGWGGTDVDLGIFTQLGYFLFFPNPRGSLGQGQAFTKANRRDWGFGDLQDTLAGVDTVVATYNVDNDRVGITGWSYGGSTSLFAVTQSHRFKAAVAGASACNLLSYYGENSIDQWMIPYFGASAYDDPAAYARSSALTYVKNVKTPTLLLVGQRDGEAPPEQSFEFWHALKNLGVPTKLVVYAGEGHQFEKHENRVDLIERSLEWFLQYMPPPATPQ